MSEQKETTLTLIERQLVIYTRERSSVFQCRYQIDKKWYRATTGTRNLAEAKAKAHELLLEANVRKRLNFVPVSKSFKNVAKYTIKKLEDTRSTPDYRPVFEEYKVIITNYLIPFFGRYNIDSITYPLIEEFNKWRTEKMNGQPTRSTELNHNAALNKVFDYAEQSGHIHSVSRPTLTTVGRASQRRDDFSLTEAVNLRANFEHWTTQTKEDSKAIRQLLRDYVLVLLDTGARPGNELLTLKWSNLEIDFRPDIFETNQTVPNEAGEAESEIKFAPKHAVILSITESKTGPRKSIGRLETYRVINDIAERNYGKKAKDLIQSGCSDYVFSFIEYIGRRKKKEAPNAKPKLLRPTSFPKLFEKYLTEHNLLLHPDTKKPRVLYSLRHTYATIALERDKVPVHTLAKQMGTSIKMLEQHYSHLDAVKAIDQLRGEESRKLLEDSSRVDERYSYSTENKVGRKVKAKK
jgi:integrase